MTRPSEEQIAALLSKYKAMAERCVKERDDARSQLVKANKVLERWKEQLTYLDDMKERGDLTRDWGECSRNNAQRIVNDLADALSVTEEQSQP